MPKLSAKLTIRQAGYRLCETPGCNTRVHGAGQFCARCYAATPEGMRENNLNTRRAYWVRKEESRLRTGQPLPAYHCQRCTLWGEGRCSIGIPEGIGTFAEDCGAFTPQMFDLDNVLHPMVQQDVQDRLEMAYLAAGRDKPDHPLHCLYTDVFGELNAKGIQLDGGGDDECALDAA